MFVSEEQCISIKISFRSSTEGISENCYKAFDKIAKTVFDVSVETFFGRAYFSKQKISTSTIVGLWNENDSNFCQLLNKDAITEHYVSSEPLIVKSSFSKFSFVYCFCRWWKKNFFDSLLVNLWQVCQSFLFFVQKNYFRQNIFLLRLFFFLMNLWLSEIKLWLQEKLLVRAVKNLLYVSLGTISRKKRFSKTVLLFHPSHFTRKKTLNLRERFSAMLSKLHSTFSEERSQENLICFGINCIFSSILEFENKFTRTFLKSSQKISTSTYICRVQRHSWSFFLWKKIQSHLSISVFDERNFKRHIKTFDRVSKAVFDVSRYF